MTCLLKMDIIQLLSPLVLLIILAQSASAMECYRCTSSQPGCGKELNIRIQRWHTCPETGIYGGENFCVKIIEKINVLSWVTRRADIVITRECLMTIRNSEKHREKIPTVQRHNYCQPGRNNDPLDPYDEDMTFCFCNDWNGCNAAEKTRRPAALMIAASVLAVLLYILS